MMSTATTNESEEEGIRVGRELGGEGGLKQVSNLPISCTDSSVSSKPLALAEASLPAHSTSTARKRTCRAHLSTTRTDQEPQCPSAQEYDEDDEDSELSAESSCLVPRIALPHLLGASSLLSFGDTSRRVVLR